MAKLPLVKCPGCNEEFSRDETEDYVHVKNRYWHTKCYNKKKNQKNIVKKYMNIVKINIRVNILNAALANK